MRVRLWIVAVLAAGLLPACGPRPDSARKRIERAGYAFTGAELVRALAERNDEVVGWFLAAGDPALIREARDANGFTPLMAATERGAADWVAKFLAAGVEVNARNQEGWSALMMAASFNEDASCARLLLEAGADPQFRDTNGWTALMQAVYKGNAAVVELLAPRSRPEIDRALLVASLAGHRDVVRVLLDHGADRHATTDDGDTPLHLAIRRGHVDTAILLLQRGADPGALNRKGESPRRLAARLGHAEISSLVDSGGTPTEIDRSARAAWLKQHGLAPADPEVDNADPDGDGASNRDEFLAGTHPGNPASRPAPIHSARLAAYHAEEIPIVLDKVADTTATLRVGDSPAVKVRPGEEIPGQPFRVVLARQRRTTDKEGLEVDVSELHLENTATGARVVLLPGMRAKSPETHAEIILPGTEAPIRIHQDEVFTPPGDRHSYRVVDLRPEQAVIRRVSDGRVFTIPAER